MTKIAIIGTGYVGLVTGTCLAESGHNVICSDISEEKIRMLNDGEMPIYEPELKELVVKNVQNGRLSFTTDIPSAIKNSKVIFSAVGTPPDENHKADLKYVKEVATVFANHINDYKIFVNKSTVPVGTGNMTEEIIKSINSDADFDIVSNPEFLREGAAVKDFLNPDRIVIGCNSKKSEKIMREIYLPFERTQSPLFFTNVKTSELIKYAANSMLATRISFMNEIANYCDIVGADVKAVAKGIGTDKRIGPRFLQAGIGYGGSCFPKDVNALIESGKEVKFSFKILEAVEEVNFSQKSLIVEKIKKELGKDLSGKKITLWGLSFKPKTDDIREAPSLYIIKELIKLNATVQVFDPVAENNYKKEHSELPIKYFNDNYEALRDSSCLVIATEWDEFRIFDYERAKTLMKNYFVADGRNIYNPDEMELNKFTYVGIGRK